MKIIDLEKNYQEARGYELERNYRETEQPKLLLQYISNAIAIAERLEKRDPVLERILKNIEAGMTRPVPVSVNIKESKEQQKLIRKLGKVAKKFDEMARAIMTFNRRPIEVKAEVSPQPIPKHWQKIRFTIILESEKKWEIEAERIE